MIDNVLRAFAARQWAQLLPGPAWRRAVLARRLVAVALAVAAGAFAVRDVSDGAGAVPIVVVAHDLAPGHVLSPADVRLDHWPVRLVPTGALSSVADVDGRALAGPANGGEPLTAARLADAALARRLSGSADAASVPIRLADSGVAGLLAPGRVVDVVTLGERSDQPTILAAAATVLTVLPADPRAHGEGRLVLIAVPRGVAPRLAAATLAKEVTVTLR